MSRPIAVLRPEPGAADTAAHAQALGLEVIRLPLFAVEPLAWTAPDAVRFDALLLTSANAVRHAGPALMRYAGLPVLAVGPATARAAADAGFAIAFAGSDGVQAVLATACALGFARLLYLHAREAVLTTHPAIALAIPVYASDPIGPLTERLDAITGAVALLHSPRAARHVAALLGPDRRARTRIAALSPSVAAAAGAGWAAVTTAAEVSDAALLAAARGLAD